MAWVEKLPSGRWRGMFRDHTGTKRSTGTFAHKREATIAAGLAEGQSRQTGWRSTDAAKTTWGDWCAEWWPTRDVAASTLLRDASRRDTHLIPRWGAVKLIDITEHDVRAWAVKLIRDGRSPATAQRCVHLLSASLRAAVRARILVTNEAAGVQVDKGHELDERYLTRAEVERIVDHMPTAQDQTIVYLLAYSGLRWGELAGLHWHRLDLASGVLTVSETLDDKNRLIVPWPKGKKERRVQLAPWLLERLGEPERGHCEIPHTRGRCLSPLVFRPVGGKALDARNWRRVFDAACADAGLEDVHPHLLRHTAASWSIQAGASLAQVGQLLGHRSPVTSRRYAHLVDEASSVLSDLPAPPPRPTHPL